MKRENKIELMKDELGGNIMKYFATLKPKIYKYLTDDSCVDKAAKDTKKCVIKRKIKFKEYRSSWRKLK